MADAPITLLPAWTTPASNDVLAIVDVAAGVTKKITVQNLVAASVLTVGTTPVNSGTVGGVFFQGVGNIFQQDAANLFYDNTNNRLGVGLNTPNATLTVKGASTGNNASFHWENSDGSQTFQIRDQGAIYRNGFIYSYADYAKNNTSWGLNSGAGWDPSLSAENNVAVGDNALGRAPNAIGNVAIGDQALNAIIPAACDHNIAIGVQALFQKTSGNYNVAIGWVAGAGNINKEGSIYLGIGADGNHNTVICIGTTATSNADNQMVIGSSTYFISHERHIYAVGPAEHHVYYRTTTAEGNQAAPRGSICHVDDGATGWAEVKATGTGNTGWVVLAASGAGVTSVSGTANRITSSGGTTPVIDIAATYVGQTSITTLGTIATGVWSGTIISPTAGGTGVNNGIRTLTVLNNSGTLQFSSVGFTLNITATASISGTNTGDVTLAGQNYLTIAGQVITAGAITLSGTHVTGVLGAANGGTGVNNSSRTLTINTTSAILDFSGAFTLTVAANASVSGTNTGDQSLAGLLPLYNPVTALTAPSVYDDEFSIYDASAAAYKKILLKNIRNPKNYLYLFDDFLNVPTQGNETGYQNALSGGSVGATNGEQNHPGIISIQTGVTTTGRAGTGTDNTGMRLGGGKVQYTMMINITNLSDGTDTYTLWNGFLDAFTGDCVDGVYFRYTHSANSGNWVLVGRSNTTETATNSAFTVAAATWYELMIEINAAGTSAEFFVNGASIGTVASNIPNGAGRTTGLVPANIIKSAGTNSRVVQLDYTLFIQEFTTPR